MTKLNLSNLIDEFAVEQEKDLSFFEKLDREELISTKVMEHILQRLYVRRKFLARFRSLKPLPLAEGEKKALLEKISQILEQEEKIKGILQEILRCLKERQADLQKSRLALKAYKASGKVIPFDRSRRQGS